MIDLVSYLTSVVRNNYNNVSLDANTCKDANHERGSMSAVGTTLVLRASTTWFCITLSYNKYGSKIAVKQDMEGRIITVITNKHGMGNNLG